MRGAPCGYKRGDEAHGEHKDGHGTYLTSRRAKEIAIRIALGAQTRDVLRLIAGQTLRWTVAGLSLGSAAAAAASGTLRIMVRGVGRLEPITLGLVSVLYLAVVAVAICLPAFKALRADPCRTLRIE